MPHFVLIDRLLAGVGGHNFQYAVDVLQAAEAAGYQPILGTRTGFDAAAALPTHWKLRPLFEHGWSRRHMAGVDGTSRRAVGIDARPLRDAGTSAATAFLVDLLDFPKRIDREKQIEDMARGCEVLFEELGFHGDDCIFVPTISEFDLLGLTRFFLRQPESARVAWHLQFHFDIFHGREPDYANQPEQMALLRRQFSSALAKLPDHQLHFYATTPQVAAQYNKLSLANFTPLPYPVSGALAKATPPASVPQDEPDGPLRITLAGAMRREKGKRALATVIDSLADLLHAGDVQIWLQSTGRKVERFLQPSWKSAVEYHEQIPADPQKPMVALTDSLAREEYLRLISNADIGLFLYDSQRYHSRCSGVLVEMLAAGVPVVVPAGCWLSEQIQEPNYAHLQSYREGHAPIWVETQDTIGVEHQRLAVEWTCPIAPGTKSIICSLSAAEELTRGHYLRVDAQSLDQAGRLVGEPQTAILGHASTSTRVWTLFRVPTATHTIQLRLSNAYHQTELRTDDLEIAGYSVGSCELPAGQVGLICADARHAPHLVRELIDAYGHYRETAAAFSHTWAHQHAPLRTVEILESRNVVVQERVA